MNVFERKGSLYASNVDVNRAARAITKFQNLSSIDKGYELIAKILGFENHYQLRQAAKDTDVTGLSVQECHAILGNKFAGKGEPFPRNSLPPRFDSKWQNDSVHLVNQALFSIPDGAIEFVAVVGGPGTGKSLVLNHIAASRNGVVLNIDNWNFNLFDSSVRKMSPEGVLVLDQCSDMNLPFLASKEGMMRLIPKGSFSTLSQFAKASRVRHDRIPGEEPGMYRGLCHHMLQTKPKTRLCMAFASTDEAVNALNATSWGIRPGQASDPLDNWVRVHVVNLDTMTLAAHEHAGLKKYAVHT